MKKTTLFLMMAMVAFLFQVTTTFASEARVQTPEELAEFLNNNYKARIIDNFMPFIFDKEFNAQARMDEVISQENPYLWDGFPLSPNVTPKTSGVTALNNGYVVWKNNEGPTVALIGPYRENKYFKAIIVAPAGATEEISVSNEKADLALKKAFELFGHVNPKKTAHAYLEKVRQAGNAKVKLPDFKVRVPEGANRANVQKSLLLLVEIYEDR